MSQPQPQPVCPPDQDPRKRKAILAAATRRFAAQGFQATDVQDVADAAGVGKGTVYRYFGHKRDLFLAVAHDGMQRLEQHVFAVLETPAGPLEQIRAAALAYAAFYVAHPEQVEIMIVERAEFRGSIPDTHLFYREKNRGPFEEILQAGLPGGTLAGLDARAVITVLANALYGTVVCSCIGGSVDRLTEDVRDAVDLILGRPTPGGSP